VQGNASDYLAAERTFLAWLRTGIALMGLGFVLARFGLFLEEFNRLDANSIARSYGLSLWIGVTLILLGVAVCLLSTVRHLHMLRQLQAGDSLFATPPRLAMGVVAVLIILGLIMAGYLILANPSPIVHATFEERNLWRLR
jgi:putative membrane protein